MKSSKWWLSIACVLLLIGLFSFTNNWGQADELKEKHNQIQLSYFIEDIGFQEKTQVIESRLSDTISLYFEWDSTGNLKDEHFYYDIPEEFYLINDTNFDLVDSVGQSIGEVVVSAKENQLRIHLADVDNQLETSGERKGVFYFTVKLNPDLWENTPYQQPIYFPLGSEEKELFVTLLPEESPSEEEILFLWGKYDKEENQVNWGTRVNHQRKEIGETSLEFQLDSESTLILESVEVFILEKDGYVLSDVKTEISQLDDRWIIVFPSLEDTYHISFKTVSNRQQTTITPKMSTSMELLLFEVGPISSDKTRGESLFND